VLLQEFDDLFPDAHSEDDDDDGGEASQDDVER
jgi:hypothetical protein